MAKIPSPIMRGSEGPVWYSKVTDEYLVTGTDRDGKRFKKQCKNWFHARGINVWRGSKWLLRGEHKFLIERITN